MCLWPSLSHSMLWYNAHCYVEELLYNDLEDTTDVPTLSHYMLWYNACCQLIAMFKNEYKISLKPTRSSDVFSTLIHPNLLVDALKFLNFTLQLAGIIFLIRCTPIVLDSVQGKGTYDGLAEYFSWSSRYWRSITVI